MKQPAVRIPACTKMCKFLFLYENVQISIFVHRCTNIKASQNSQYLSRGSGGFGPAGASWRGRCTEETPCAAFGRTAKSAQGNGFHNFYPIRRVYSAHSFVSKLRPKQCLKMEPRQVPKGRPFLTRSWFPGKR